MRIDFQATPNDIETILKTHGIHNFDVNAVFDHIDCDDVEAAISKYEEFNDQLDAAYCEIEDQLIALRIVQAEKKFKV